MKKILYLFLCFLICIIFHSDISGYVYGNQDMSISLKSIVINKHPAYGTDDKVTLQIAISNKSHNSYYISTSIYSIVCRILYKDGTYCTIGWGRGLPVVCGKSSQRCSIKYSFIKPKEEGIINFIGEYSGSDLKVGKGKITIIYQPSSQAGNMCYEDYILYTNKLELNCSINTSIISKQGEKQWVILPNRMLSGTKKLETRKK